ncbi:MAG: hypothetical protein M1276_03485 [Deltaproteobacteria bacterium]|nr:hypothetical protein [Deltaproteobacteria bacterium]
MLKKLNDLIEKAGLFSPKTAAVVVAEEELVIDGILKSYKSRLIIPKLIGNKNKILSLLKKNRLNGFNSGNYKDIEIIDAENDANAAYIAVKLASEKKVDIIIKGHIHTDILMHQLLHTENGLRTNRFV